MLKKSTSFHIYFLYELFNDMHICTVFLYFECLCLYISDRNFVLVFCIILLYFCFCY